MEMNWAILYKEFVFALLILGTGLLIWYKVLTPWVFWSRVQYYTIVSNIIILFYLAAVTAGSSWTFLYTADCRYMMGTTIFITCVMYHFMVAPGAIKTHKLNDVEFEHYSAYNFLLHYIVPLLMMGDWIFLTDKRDAHWYSMFTWLVIPAFYTGFIYVRAWLTRTFHGRSNLYPYAFLDPRIHSTPVIIRNILLVGGIFFMIGVGSYLAGMAVPRALLQ